MDRREALKKLGAGGALVVASPVLLPTFRVAHAASPAGTDIVGVPDEGEPLPVDPITFPSSKNKQKQVALAPDMSAVSCAGSGVPLVSYEWQIGRVRWQKSKVAYLRITEATNNAGDPAGAELIAMPASASGHSGWTSYSAPSYATGFVVRKGSSKGDVKIDQADQFTIRLRVRWHCDGATSDLEAEYDFAGTGTNMPTVANTSWNIVAA